MNRQIFAAAISVIGLLLFAAVSYACKIPVFRYALERWPADRYTMVAIVDADPDEDVRRALQALDSFDRFSANINVEIIDLSQLSEAELWSVEGLENTEDAPLLQVFYPDKKSDQRRLCWSGALTLENVQLWRQSPLREKIVGDLESGVSAVWVFVEGDDSDENTTMHSELKAALKQAESTVSIPTGVIRREDAARVLKEDPLASMDDVLRCDIPLKVKFSTVVLSPDDPQEAALVAMIRGLPHEVTFPCTIPVFGRGRMIEPLPMSAFSEQSVVSACNYLFGECSCSVKALNPGVDLVLDADWKKLLGEQILVTDTVTDLTPELLEIPSGEVNSDSTPPSQNPVSLSASGTRHFGRVYEMMLLAAGATLVTILSFRGFTLSGPSS